jgi:hypothetical protein
MNGDQANSDEVQKTTAALVAVQDQLPAETKDYVQAKLKEAEAKNTANATTASAEPHLPPVVATSDNLTLAEASSATEIKQQAAENAVALTKGTVEGTVAQKISEPSAGSSPSTPDSNDPSPVSNEEIAEATAPLREIVDATNEATKDLPVGSSHSDDATVVNLTVAEAAVPAASSDLTDQEAVPTPHETAVPQQPTPTVAPSAPPPDPNKTRNSKPKEALDNASSLKLEAELLTAINVIEHLIKQPHDGAIPYAQLRELRLRLDSKRGGDLRNLAEPSKGRVLKRLDELDNRLKIEGKARAQAKKNYAESDLLRVGFLFPEETQRLNVRLEQIQLNRSRETPFYCPAIQNVGKKGNIPATTEVRYFEYSIFGWLNPRDAESHASRLAAQLRARGVGNVRTVYYKPQLKDERPGNFEVWFSRSAFKQ